MPDLIVRIKKKSDGAAVLSCTRANGTVTWQRQEGSQGRFFPLHDLTHFVVERTLGFRHAFYGLIAEGWDIGFFAEPAARAVTPPEALLAELIVGVFDLERGTGIVQSAADVNWRITSYLADNRQPATTFRMTELQLARIRDALDALFAHWNATAAGDTLELSLDLPVESGV